MADAPERIFADMSEVHQGKGTWEVIPFEIHPDSPKYVRADLTPPAAVVEAMERALRHADQVSRDLGWHRIYDETGDALAALTAWRAGK